ncbi:MAG: dihydrolipoyl dehydrogenase [Elusimicrobiota bacterium]
MKQKYDAAIIGCGPAGYRAALKLKEHDKNICIVELDKKEIGGTCLNRGCIPVKSFLESAEVYNTCKKAAEFGIETGPLNINKNEVKNSAFKNVAQLKKGLEFILNKSDICAVFGKAQFVSDREIEVIKINNEKLNIQADNFIIATGSKPREIPGIETDGKYILNTRQIIDSPLDGSNILIVGGGYIGCELSSFYRIMGKDVTIVELSPNLMPFEGDIVSKTLLKQLKKQGVKIITESKLVKADKINNGVKCEIYSKNNEEPIFNIYDRIILAVGRVPNTSELNLDRCGIETEKGFIKTNSNLQTNIENIYAAGDVLNTPMLAHVALKEGETAAQSILGNNPPEINYLSIPRIIFSHPQIGCTGMTIEQARQKGIEINTIKKQFTANSKAVISHSNKGFFNLMYDKNTGTIVGGTVVGPYACELVHVLCIAVNKGIKINEMNNFIFGHPTLSEIFDI